MPNELLKKHEISLQTSNTLNTLKQTEQKLRLKNQICPKHPRDKSSPLQKHSLMDSFLELNKESWTTEEQHCSTLVKVNSPSRLMKDPALLLRQLIRRQRETFVNPTQQMKYHHYCFSQAGQLHHHCFVLMYFPHHFLN